MAGRSNKYDTHIKPHFEKIDKMLNEGASEKQVAENLGVSYPAWNNYKTQHPEFKELCSKPRQPLIEDLRSALVKKALGFEYEEMKVYTVEDEDGNKKKHIEKVKKYCPPDTTAIFGALNIYDPDYVKDKKQYELKQKELELRKMMAEAKEW